MEEKNNIQQKGKALSDIVAITYIRADNAVFAKKNDFISLKLTAPNAEGITETKEYDRLFLHRVFPFDNPYAYISVLDRAANEIGLIADMQELKPEDAEILRAELDRKYYTPVIRSILSMKDKFGFSYWKVMTDEGEMNFTLHDTFHSMMKVDGGNRIFITDVDGNRYEIPDLEKLDRKSYRKIELFL